MRHVRRATGAVVVLWLTACATRGVIGLPGSGQHPADPAARVPAFRPAPDPLLREPAPDPQPESAMPMSDRPRPGAASDGGAKSGHEGHRAPTGKQHESHDAEARPRDEAQTPDGGHEHDPGRMAEEERANSSEAIAAEDRMVRAYLTLVRALAEDDFDGAKRALESMRSETAALARSGVRGDVATAVQRVANALPAEPKTIADLRRDLKGLSETLTDLVRLAPPTRDAAPQLRKVYCPMSDASWLQVESDVANPYFGSKMPRCGRVTETIQTRPASERD